MKTILVTILSVTALCISVLAGYSVQKNSRKIGFVLVNEVFSEFEMKKELELKYAKTKNARKKIMDSLEIDLSVLAGRIKQNIASSKDKEMFDRKRVEYNQKAQIFEEDNTVMSKEFDKQIITQLNQYIADFGKENNYDIIYGNTSDGSIMYGTDELNLTKDVISFINSKYKGIK